MATRVTRKGQVTIPKQVRTHLGIKPGDQVSFAVVAGGAVELRPENDREALRGAIADVRRRRPAQLGMSVDEYMALIRDEP